MPNLNKVMIMGNLTRDPEIKYTPNGTAVAELGIAVSRKYKSGDQMMEETTFVDVELWGKTAEVAAEHLQKGKPVFIEGRLKLDTWDDKQTGQKRSKMRVVGEHMEFLGSRGDGGGGDRPQQSQQRRPQGKPVQQRRQAAPLDPELDGSDDDDLPF